MRARFHDVKQNSDEWFALRAGKLTTSKMGTIMANLGYSFGEPAKKHAVNIALEQITGYPIESDYSNSHMQRGHREEPIACMQYEYEKFCEVKNGGFFDAGFVGSSPDGRVDSNGGVEIKCVVPHVHLANIKRGGIDPAYKWQCIGELTLMGVEWLDFISYCSQFPEDKQLFICRLHAEDIVKEQRDMIERINEFECLIMETRNLILNGKYETSFSGQNYVTSKERDAISEQRSIDAATRAVERIHSSSIINCSCLGFEEMKKRSEDEFGS